MLNSCKMLQKQFEAFHTFCGIFPSLKQNLIAYRFSKVSSRRDCIFEIHQLWQSGFSRVYSNCCCSCSFEPEIIKIGQSSHKMYTNNILNFPESSTIFNACTKKSENLFNSPRKTLFGHVWSGWPNGILTFGNLLMISALGCWSPKACHWNGFLGKRFGEEKDFTWKKNMHLLLQFVSGLYRYVNTSG